VKGQKVDSGVNHLGTFIGNNVKIGIRVSTMPGVIIGNNAVVGPQTVVFRNIDEGVTFYSRFHDIVEKIPDFETEDVSEKQTVVLFDIDYTLFDTGKFKESELSEYILYDEVIEVLETLGAVVKLGIFSEGDLDFQKTKLVNTLIHEHFAEEHVHIVNEKHATITTILEKYRDDKLILVDDKLEVLKMAKGLSQNVYTIWVKRGPFAERADEASFTPDARVTQLHELIKIISNV
jgi:FMN phosphatase YigB (HAD superfamily)